MSCIFCKIVQKQSEAAIIYEDEDVMAFLDIMPVNEGHCLVIPKKHHKLVEGMGYISPICNPLNTRRATSLIGG